MNVFPFILEELGMIALMEVVFLLLRVKGRGFGPDTGGAISGYRSRRWCCALLCWVWASGEQ